MVHIYAHEFMNNDGMKVVCKTLSHQEDYEEVGVTTDAQKWRWKCF